MAYNTKINLTDDKVFQSDGQLLTLSGNTVVASVGDLRYQTHPNFTGDTQIVDKTYVDDNVVSGVTGGTVYMPPLLSPAAINVGGISAGYVITGKTSNEIIQDLLFPELYGTLTAPSVSTTLVAASGVYEVGCPLSFNVCSTFDRGSINPQYCSASPFRSGAANSFCFTGAQVIGNYACTALSTSKPVTSYNVLLGANTWGTCVSYDAGVQPKSNKNNNFDSPLGAGTTSASNATIIGAYPVYGTTVGIGTLTKQTLVNMSTTNCVQVNMVAETGGEKQKFEIPCAWLGAPTNRPLIAIELWNTTTNSWECPGGSAASSLARWTTSSATETIQSSIIGYCRYTHNDVDREGVCIRLKFA